ncbi:MAG TPA: hypothetical protein DCK83_07000 [Gallionellaceae bacterium]|nr:hypothetical protein [Gallionellaceae bacterium]
MSPFNYWLAVVVSSIALFGIGYAYGDKHASSACAIDQTQAQQAAQAKVDETNTGREQVAQSRETSREQIRVVYRTIKEKANENPVTADCSLDANSLRLWNAANANTAAPLLGKLDYRLSSTATGEVGKVGGLARQPHRVDGALQPMPRPAP